MRAQEGVEAVSGWTRSHNALQLSLLTFVALSGMYARASLGPIQEALRSALSLSDNQIALLQGPALAIPLLVFSVPLGVIADRYSRRAILIVASLGNGIATALGSLAPSFHALLATRCFVGLCAPATAIAAYSILADLYIADRRGAASTVLSIGQVAGTACAFVVGGALFALLGPEASGWRAVMLVSGCVLLIPVLLATAITEPVRTERGSAKGSPDSLGAQLWRHRVVIAVLVTGMAMVSLADGAALVWTAPTLSRRFGLSASHVGALTGTALLIGGIVGPLLGGPLADWCQRKGGPQRTVALVGFLSLVSAPSGLFGVVPDPWVSICVLVLFLALGSATSVIVLALSIIVIPNELRGTCMALEYGAGAVFGLGVAPVTVSFLAEQLAGPLAIGAALALVCATTCFVGGIIFLSQRRAFGTVM